MQKETTEFKRETANSFILEVGTKRNRIQRKVKEKFLYTHTEIYLKGKTVIFTCSAV